MASDLIYIDFQQAFDTASHPTVNTNQNYKSQVQSVIINVNKKLGYR